VSGEDDEQGRGDDPSPFDATDLIERWRRIEPRLRQKVARFAPLSEDDLDDLISDVLVRFVAKQVVVRGDWRLLAMAEAAARWIWLSRQRREERRSRVLRRSRVTIEEILGSGTGPSGHGLDAEERALLRAAVDARLARLSPAEKRVVALLRRGGPYTGAERVAIHRGRAALPDLFRDLLGGIGVMWGRWRARLSEPHPAFPVAAGAVSAVTLVGFAASGAATSTAAPPAVERPAAKVAAVSAPVTDAGAGALLATSRVSPTARGGSRPAPLPASPLLGAGGTARLPGPERPGEASITLARPPTDSWTALSITVSCDTDLRRTVCEKWSPPR
jgi:hypothetical protein